jgi:hypothetical protein
VSCPSAEIPYAGLNQRQLIIEPGFLQVRQFDAFDVTGPIKAPLISFFPVAARAKLTPTLQQLRNLARTVLRTENNLHAPQCRAIRSRR